jgi:flagellar biosynthesis/type III secretory pathway M-ring protein FliF/YscJ
MPTWVIVLVVFIIVCVFAAVAFKKMGDAKADTKRQQQEHERRAQQHHENAEVLEQEGKDEQTKASEGLVGGDVATHGAAMLDGADDRPPTV